MGWTPCCCPPHPTNDCSPCCSGSPDTATVDWDGGLTALANCDGCDKLAAGDYDATYEASYAPMGLGCYWIYEYTDATIYALCASGRIYGTEDANGTTAEIVVALINDIISGKCYLAAIVTVDITSVAGALSTTNFLAGAIYISDQSAVSDFFCSGDFTLNLMSADPTYHDAGGNSIWDGYYIFGDPFLWTNNGPYSDGCSGSFPSTLTVTF